MQLPKLPKKESGAKTLNQLLQIFSDSDKSLVAVILLMLMRENADKSLIFALIYILFA